MYVLDLILVGAVKRTMSLASGMKAMIEAKNIVCARALLRMQLDTVSRVLAYTYVPDAGQMAEAVLGGQSLRKFKSCDGNALNDAYLIRRMSVHYPWVTAVYESTSGYVHFSERQLFDSVQSLRDSGSMTLEISAVDNKYPDFSWEEIAACFNHLTKILASALKDYAEQKSAHHSSRASVPTQEI